MSIKKMQLHYKIAAILILVLGLIHVLATPLVMANLQDWISQHTVRFYLCLFLLDWP